MNLSEKTSNQEMEKKQLSIFWLGQAGYLIKNSDGKRVAIDPYLSDCCMRLCNFKRLTPMLISAEELQADILCCSHDHPDHFDYDSMQTMMAEEKTQFVGSVTSALECEKLGVSKNRITALRINDEIDYGWLKVKAVYADHGDLAPDALGMMLYMNNIKIYYVGDTSLRLNEMSEALAEKPDVIILPINGAFGNLNAQEAAQLAEASGAKYAIPCHFWTFAEHGGDPMQFAEEMKRVNGTQAVFLRQGESIVISK